MLRVRIRRAAALFTLLVCTSGVPLVTAQEPSEDLTQEQITKLKSQVESDETLDPELAKELVGIYGRAAAQIKLAEDQKALLDSYRKLQSESADDYLKLKEKLDKPETPASIQVPVNAAVPELDQQLTTTQGRLQEWEETLQDLQDEKKRRETRRANVPGDLQKARGQLEDLEKALAANPPNGEPAAVTQANKTLLQATLQRIQAELKTIPEELPAYTASTELLNAQIKEAEREQKLAQEEARLWQAAIEKQKTAEREAQAQAARAALEQSDPLVRKYARDNENLAILRKGSAGLPARILIVTQQLELVNTRLKDLKTEQVQTEEQLAIPGMEEVIGPKLLRLRKRLPNLRALRQKIRERQKDISEARFQQLQLREQLADFPEVDRLLYKITQEAEEPVSDARRQKLKTQLTDLLKTKRTLVEQENEDYTVYINRLYELSAAEQELINTIRAFAQTLDEHILWVRSTERVGAKDVASGWAALVWVFDPNNWLEIAQVLRQRLEDRVFLSMTSLLLFVVLLFIRRKLRVFQKELNRRMAEPGLSPFRYTLQAFVSTILMAMVWPLLMFGVGYTLLTSKTENEFVPAMGSALLWTSFVSFTLETLRRIVRTHGLAEVHFRWRRKRLDRFVVQLRFLLAFGLPCVFLYALMQNQPRESFNNSLGRLALVVALGMLSFTISRIFRTRGIEQKDNPLPVPVAKLTFWEACGQVLAIFSPLALAVLALFGYYYTASELTSRLFFTVWLILALIIFRAMAMKWLFKVRGELALEQTRKQKVAAEVAVPGASVSVPVEPLTITPPDPPVDQPTSIAALEEQEQQEWLEQQHPSQMVLGKEGTDLGVINQQTRRFLHLLLGASLFLGLWAIWSPVFPAIGVLDHPLWTSVTNVTRTAPGTSVQETYPVAKVITPVDLVFAIVIFVIAYLAASNIPGLMEVAFLHHLPLDAGGRYAVTTLGKYLLMLVGVVVSFGWLGFQWSKMQWLVAALGVGLGFGLQEIFANFISGLILLFERPIRVGDIITIADTSGIVTRIRIRATTVRNWDRKEFIVPNKELITGKLLNWTLSDSINRVVISVGVAYGSNTDQCYGILMRVMNEHPEVVVEPPPTAVFDGFGDNSLNFVARCFLSKMEVRLQSIHELHTNINKEFAKAGIEIAFPQRDLHIRSSDIPLGEGRRKKDEA